VSLTGATSVAGTVYSFGARVHSCFLWDSICCFLCSVLYVIVLLSLLFYVLNNLSLYLRFQSTLWYPQEKFEDTKRVIRSRKSKKNRQCNDKHEKNKTKNNDLQNTTQKTKD